MYQIYMGSNDNVALTVFLLVWTTVDTLNSILMLLVYNQWNKNYFCAYNQYQRPNRVYPEDCNKTGDFENIENAVTSEYQVSDKHLSAALSEAISEAHTSIRHNFVREHHSASL